jgi:hypothetical protein
MSVQQPSEITKDIQTTYENGIILTEKENISQHVETAVIVEEEKTSNSSIEKSDSAPASNEQQLSQIVQGENKETIPVQIKTEAKDIINALLNYDSYKDLDPTLDPHLLIIVHGIGASPARLYTQITRMRTSINAVRKVKKDQFRAPIILHMVDWKSSLSIEVKDKIERMTLKANKKQRTMLNEVPVDALFYLTSDHAHTILNEVSTQANTYYDQLILKYPGLKASILSHSLGTVIAYDLITCKKRKIPYIREPTKITALNFPVENIFNLGSPLGLFLTITDGDFHLLDKEGFCNTFYNIFHPNDLVAYRIEPMIEGYPDLNPEEIPYIKNDGFKTHTKKKIIKEKFKEIKELASIEFSTLTRYDYILQEGFFENMFETLGILGGHWGYWDSQDLFYFILKKLNEKSATQPTNPTKL